MDLSKLRDKFSDDDLEWRIQSVVGKAKDKAIIVPYVTNRAIMDRLDEVCSPENWTNQFIAGPDGGVVCTIGIRTKDGWVFKSDGAENSAIESVKGGLSNSMKRAAVQWGIGRYLYSLPRFFASPSKNGENYQKDFGAWNPPKLDGGGRAPAKREEAKFKDVPEPVPFKGNAVTEGAADFF